MALEALNRALELFGHTISLESHLSTFDGLPTRVKLDMLTKSRGLPIGLHSFINELKQAYTVEISHQRCKPVFNHQYALTRLKKDGYKLAVCSNSIRRTIETMLDLAGLSKNLDFVISNQEVRNGKPDPEMYLKAMKTLKVEPNECLILEDNHHGIKAAKASGGHLLKIGVPAEVTYQSIKNRIMDIEG